jgi:hypothetical protein
MDNFGLGLHAAGFFPGQGLLVGGLRLGCLGVQCLRLVLVVEVLAAAQQEHRSRRVRYAEALDDAGQHIDCGYLPLS